MKVTSAFLSSLFISLILILFFSIFYQSLALDFNFVFALMFIPFGNIFIGHVVRTLHENGKTGERDLSDDMKLEDKRERIREIAGSIESYFYTFLFLFGELTLLAGWLVIKSIGKYRIDDSKPNAGNENLARKEGASVGVFRIGNLLSIGVAFVAALLLKNSVLTQTSLYQSVERLFQPLL